MVESVIRKLYTAALFANGRTYECLCLLSCSHKWLGQNQRTPEGTGTNTLLFTLHNNCLRQSIRCVEIHWCDYQVIAPIVIVSTNRRDGKKESGTFFVVGFNEQAIQSNTHLIGHMQPWIPTVRSSTIWATRMSSEPSSNRQSSVDWSRWPGLFKLVAVCSNYHVTDHHVQSHSSILVVAPWRFGLGNEESYNYTNRARTRGNSTGFVDLGNEYQYAAGGHQASGPNELFAEDQGDKPWWRTSFFISQPVLFGTWDGVFTSVLINIFGVIVFLRSGWIVAQTGIFNSVLIVFGAVSLALISVLAAVGICERCRIESGGVYFLIAHTLGSRFGGSLGLLYCFGQAVGCALNVLGEKIFIWPTTTQHHSTSFHRLMLLCPKTCRSWRIFGRTSWIRRQ